MPMLEGVDDEVTVVMTAFLMLMGLVVTWLFTSFQQETQQQQQQHQQQQNYDQQQRNNDQQQRNDGESPEQNEETRNTTAQSNTDRSNTDLDPGENADSVVEDERAATSDDTTNEDGEENIPEPVEGHIRVKIKYLDDRVRCVLTPRDTPIDAFKRSHFAQELEQELLVRLIHNGRELQGQRTLEQYDIDDLSTIHCLVVPKTRLGTQEAAETDVADLDLSNLMLPMFTLILALIWYCRILYRNFFNALSTLALVGITLLYVFTLFMTWRSNRPVQPGTETRRTRLHAE